MPNTHYVAGGAYEDDIFIALYKPGTVWLTRHHCSRSNGASVIVLQSVESGVPPLLSRKDGDRTLLALMRLHKAPLPGEKAQEFYKGKVQLRRKFTELKQRLYAETLWVCYEAELLGEYRASDFEDTRKTFLLLLRRYRGEHTRQERTNLLREVELCRQGLERLKLEASAQVEKADRWRRDTPTRNPQGHFYFSTQSRYGNFRLWHDLTKLAESVGTDARADYYFRSTNDYFYRLCGMKFYGVRLRPCFNKGIGRGKCPLGIINFQTGEITEVRDHNIGTWFYDEEDRRALEREVKRAALSVRDKPWFLMYHLPDEIHFRTNYSWGKNAPTITRGGSRRSMELSRI